MMIEDIYVKEAREYICKLVNDENDRLDVNADLIQILHGNLTDPLTKKLKQDMPKTWKDCVDRLMPINLYRRIIDKMTHIYQTGVERQVTTASDQEAIDRYALMVDANDEFNYNNMLFNTFGYSLQSIAKDDAGFPYTVAIDNDKFIPVSLSKGRKNKMDLLVLIMGQENNLTIFWVWTDNQFMIMDSEGKVREDHMLSLYGDDFDGDMRVNPYGVIPYTYITSSKTSIMPQIAKDDLQIALTLAVLMSDMNYISKFTAFAIIWTLDIDTENLPVAPNVNWNLKSGSGDIGEEGKKPQIGTIKPEADTDKLISSIMFQVSLYLDSKGVPTGAIGKVDGQNHQSGISKIIDMMDTTDLREKQTKVYSRFEWDYFNRFMHFMNPIWINETEYMGDRHSYNGATSVVTTFPIQRPLINRMEVINEVEKEMKLGLMTKESALKRLNPNATDEDIQKMLEDLEAEAPEPVTPNPNQLMIEEGE